VVFRNPVALLMPLLHWESPGWLDDIVTGSIATSASSSKGQLNVRPSAVYAALFLHDVTAAAVRHGDMSERTSQAVAQSARHAARGIDHYLAMNPKVRSEFQKLYEMEKAQVCGL